MKYSKPWILYMIKDLKKKILIESVFNKLKVSQETADFFFKYKKKVCKSWEKPKLEIKQVLIRTHLIALFISQWT